MRPRLFVFLTIALALCSLVIGWKVFVEDYGPFDGWINFHSTQLLDRESLGYTTLPEYHPYPAGGGYFDLYANNWGATSGVGLCVYDEPYWPDGDPGLVAQNPLPPQVRRHTIRAYSPNYGLVFLGVGWSCWTVMLLRSLLRRPPRGRGFDVVGT